MSEVTLDWDLGTSRICCVERIIEGIFSLAVYELLFHFSVYKEFKFCFNLADLIEKSIIDAIGVIILFIMRPIRVNLEVHFATYAITFLMSQHAVLHLNQSMLLVCQSKLTFYFGLEELGVGDLPIAQVHVLSELSEISMTTLNALIQCPEQDTKSEKFLNFISLFIIKFCPEYEILDLLKVHIWISDFIFANIFCNLGP